MFYVLAEKAIGKKGFTVRNHRAEIVYQTESKADANRACQRLNSFDVTRTPKQALLKPPSPSAR